MISFQDITAKLQEIISEVRESATAATDKVQKVKLNMSLNSTWKEGRENGLALYGAVRCSFASIYYPGKGGHFTRIFNLQAVDFFNEPIIEDCLFTELDVEKVAKAFGTPDVNCPVEKVFNPHTLHIGKLTQEAFKFVKACTKGAVTSRYICYRPDQFVWAEGDKQSGGSKKALALGLAAMSLLLN